MSLSFIVLVALLRRTSSPTEVAYINLTEKCKFHRRGTSQQSKELMNECIHGPGILIGALQGSKHT